MMVAVEVTSGSVDGASEVVVAEVMAVLVETAEKAAVTLGSNSVRSSWSASFIADIQGQGVFMVEKGVQYARLRQKA